ncbi:MAG: hypothetical protein MJ224_05380 [archaeon]|nr:hypothetical protein [archaeon]
MSSLTGIIGIIIAALGVYIAFKKLKLVITILIILLIFYMLYHFIIPGLQTGTLLNQTSLLFNPSNFAQF